MRPGAEAEADLRAPATRWVELALWLCTLALVASFGRVFEDGSFAPGLLVVGTAAHMVPALLRRWGLGPRTAVPTSLAVGTVVIAVVHLRSTTFFGLPTTETAVAAGRAMRSAFAPFRELVAPVPARLGFLLALSCALWVIVTFADAAAVWARATVQAIVPHTAVFLFTAVLARSEQAAPAALGYASALTLLALAARGRTASPRFVVGGAEPARRSQARAGLAVGAVSVGLLSALAPVAPGVSTDGVVDLRRLGRGDGPRKVDNPLVGVSSLLGPRSDEVMFTVTDSPRPHYWRLTALETFDGDTWTSTATYRDVDDGELLPTDVPGGDAASDERHRFELTGLVSDWLPAAAVPRAVRADFDVRFHAESASLFTADPEQVSARRTYEVESATGGVGFDDLVGAAARAATRSPDPALRELPPASRRALGDLALRLTAGAPGPAAQALALEAWFRDEANGFSYSTEVDYRRAPDPVLAFLEARVGFCQQYAGTFAAMARAIGLPARVAVGFTFGDPGPEGGTWVVRGRHAHAWPEVFVDGVGWLAFEPTPDRGNPDAESYTGRPPTQAPPADGVALTTTTVAPATSAPVTAPPASAPLPSEPDVATGATTDPGTGTVTTVLVLLGGVLAALAAALGARWAWVRRRRARRGGLPPTVRVAAAWTAAWRAAARRGIEVVPAETPAEAGRRLGRALGSEAPARLAALESDRRYAPGPPDEADAAAAEAASDEILDLVSAGLRGTARARMELEL